MGPVEWAGAGCGPVFAETVGAFDDVVLRVGPDSGLVCATFVVPSAGIAPGGLRCAVMGRMSPSHADSALLGHRGDGPRLTASRDRVKHHVGLKEALGGGGGAVVGYFNEDSRGEADTLTGGNDESWFLNEFNGLPLGVAGDGLV